MNAEEQFAVVFERHYRDVERFLWRRAPDLAINDLVAEVFLIHPVWPVAMTGMDGTADDAGSVRAEVGAPWPKD